MQGIHLLCFPVGYSVSILQRFSYQYHFSTFSRDHSFNPAGTYSLSVDEEVVHYPRHFISKVPTRSLIEACYPTLPTLWRMAGTPTRRVQAIVQ